MPIVVVETDARLVALVLVLISGGS